MYDVSVAREQHIEYLVVYDRIVEYFNQIQILCDFPKQTDRRMVMIMRQFQVHYYRHKFRSRCWLVIVRGWWAATVEQSANGPPDLIRNSFYRKLKTYLIVRGSST